MSRFFLNLLRSARKNCASWIGAVLIISLGVLSYIGSIDVYYNLEDKLDRYYSDTGFADVFATVVSMPAGELSRLEHIEGVETAFGRLSADARLVREDSSHIVQVHLLAVTDEDRLNRVLSDADLSGLGSEQMLVGTKMAEHYSMQAGDRLELLYDGNLYSYYFAGTVNAPEYIYAIPSVGSFLPDPEIYDVAALSPGALEQITGMDGMVTELGFTLSPGYDLEDVRGTLEEELEDYGLLSLCDQEEQPSNSMLRSEMSQLLAMAAILPLLFLTISIFMLYIVLRKMIEKDRTLIGTVKAFGAGDRELLGAYLMQGAVLGVAGGLAAAVLAIPLGKSIFHLYVELFNLPYTDYVNYTGTRIAGLVMSIGTSLLATLIGVRSLLSIQPAESMRPAAPEIQGRFQLPSLLNRMLNARQKLGLRSIFRSPLRSAVIALAVAFPFAVVAALYSVESVVEQLLFDQQTKIQTYDLKVDLDRYVPYSDALSAGMALEHTYEVEAIASYSVQVACANHSEFSTLTALNPGSQLYRIMSSDGIYYDPPDDGVLLSASLAEDLGVTAGDTVELESAYLSSHPVAVPVTGVVSETFAGGCYMSVEAVARFFSAPKAANAIVFEVEAGQLDTVKTVLLGTSQVAAVTDTDKILEGYQEQLSTMLSVVAIFGFMGLISGLVLIYNIAGISIRERQNEFGTLMVLGMTGRELMEILFFEQLINFCAGILLGFPLSHLFGRIVERVIEADSYTLHLTISPPQYALAFLACLVVEVLSLALLSRLLLRIQPGDVLKERE